MVFIGVKAANYSASQLRSLVRAVLLSVNNLTVTKITEVRAFSERDVTVLERGSLIEHCVRKSLCSFL